MFQLFAVVGVEGQFHLGSSEDKPGPGGKNDETLDFHELDANLSVY